MEELLPVVSSNRNGLMDSSDYVFGFRRLSLSKNTGIRLLQITGTYNRFSIVVLGIRGIAFVDINAVCSTESEENKIHTKKYVTPPDDILGIALYAKDNDIYIFNSNNADMAVLLVSCLGGTSKIADVKFDNKINELTDDYVPFTK